MKNDFILLGVMVVVFAIPFSVCIIKMVRGRYNHNEDSVLFYLGLLSLCYSIVFGMYLYWGISSFLSPPVISSCIPVVTQENDTLYEFHDSTRYCKGVIEKGEVSNTFVITKETATAGLYSTDTCEICGHQLREHSKSQQVGHYDIDIDYYIPDDIAYNNKSTYLASRIPINAKVPQLDLCATCRRRFIHHYTRCEYRYYEAVAARNESFFFKVVAE